MEHIEIEKIIVKFINREANDVELKILESWLKKDKNEKTFNQFIKVEYITATHLSNYNVEKAKATVKTKYKVRNKTNYFIKKFSIAASIVVLIGFSLFKNTNKNIKKDTTSIQKQTKTRSNKASLTLDDGSTIMLKKGQPFQTTNASSNGEEIIYDKNQNHKKEIAYNYLTIPRGGGQFFIKLFDGTQVWLNSESQLKYPVTFKKGAIREVELVYGEAYFDVSPSSKNNGSKFIVLNKSQKIEVLGTVFNLKAYRDEDKIYTTLIEGKVSINSGKLNKFLKPKEQSVLDIKNNEIQISEVNIYNEISWKEGVFSFERKPLKEIMKVLSRWYDVEFVFENKSIENVKFFGVLDKEQKIEEILKSIKKFKLIKGYEIKNHLIILK